MKTAILFLFLAVPALGQPTGAANLPKPGDDDDAKRPVPILVTTKTRSDPATIAALETPGTPIFRDDFESPESLKSYFEIRGLKEGHARLTTDPALAHSGTGALQLTSAANNGNSSGSGVERWLGNDGFDRVYLRVYIKFAADFDQGNLNHTGPTLSGIAGNDKWAGMGAAGLRPKGDDTFDTRLEPWRDWGRLTPPGYLFFYTYWMDMKRDRDGHFWGNMLGPAESERSIPTRAAWYCIEEMIKANTPGKADGELAGWIDGKLYIHYTGIRWRSTDAVKLKRIGLLVYVHKAAKDNTVWYDDLEVSTGYVGPMKPAAPGPTPK